jgi:hypothetical protein
MSLLLNQRIETVRHGQSSVATTVVKLTAQSDTVELPQMAAAANSVVQLRRVGDSIATISQTDINTVSVTGKIGQEVLLVSLHDDPVVESGR